MTENTVYRSVWFPTACNLPHEQQHPMPCECSDVLKQSIFIEDICTFCRSSAQNAADTSHQEMWRMDALLSAERDRARLLENQLTEAQEAQNVTLNKKQAADAELREAEAKAADSARKCVHLQAQVKTLQGRIKVLDTELKGAQQEEATLREALLEAQTERGSSAHTAAKESSALSASLRTSHARCDPPCCYIPGLCITSFNYAGLCKGFLLVWHSTVS
jgi:hypothetical protein